MTALTAAAIRGDVELVALRILEGPPVHSELVQLLDEGRTEPFELHRFRPSCGRGVGRTTGDSMELALITLRVGREYGCDSPNHQARRAWL